MFLLRSQFWRTFRNAELPRQAWGHSGGWCLCKPVGRDEIWLTFLIILEIMTTVTPTVCERCVQTCVWRIYCWSLRALLVTDFQEAKKRHLELFFFFCNCTCKIIYCIILGYHCQFGHHPVNNRFYWAHFCARLTLIIWLNITDPGSGASAFCSVACVSMTRMTFQYGRNMQKAGILHRWPWWDFQHPSLGTILIVPLGPHSVLESWLSPHLCPFN